MLTKDNYLLKMDPVKKYKTLLKVPLTDVSSISISTDSPLVIVHLNGQNDFVLALRSPRYAEFINLKQSDASDFRYKC